MPNESSEGTFFGLSGSSGGNGSKGNGRAKASITLGILLVLVTQVAGAAWYSSKISTIVSSTAKELESVKSAVNHMRDQLSTLSKELIRSESLLSTNTETVKDLRSRVRDLERNYRRLNGR